MLPSNLTMTGSEFQTIGAATEKARVLAFVFILLVECSCLGFLAGVSIEFRYAGSDNERPLYKS